MDKKELIEKIATDIVSVYKTKEVVKEGVTIIDVDMRLDIISTVQHGYEEDMKAVTDNRFDFYNDVFDCVISKCFSEGYMVFNIEEGEDDVQILSDKSTVMLNQDKIDFVVDNTEKDFVICKLH